MYFSIILMMAQKDALNQLMNLGALWALNNFDNFCYFVFDMAIAKNPKHRYIINEDKFMKFKVSENMIDSAIYWIEWQTVELLLYYTFNFWN